MEDIVAKASNALVVMADFYASGLRAQSQQAVQTEQALRLRVTALEAELAQATRKLDASRIFAARQSDAALDVYDELMERTK